MFSDKAIGPKEPQGVHGTTPASEIQSAAIRKRTDDSSSGTIDSLKSSTDVNPLLSKTDKALELDEEKLKGARLNTEKVKLSFSFLKGFLPDTQA